MLGLLHQLGPGRHGLDHGSRQDRGDAVQVRVGRGRQPVADPRQPGEDVGRRHRVRPGQLHARLRRVRGRRSSRAAPRAARPRWSSSTPIIRTSSTSSTARPTRSRRRGRSSSRATTPRFTGEAYGSVFFQNANHSRARDGRLHARRRARRRLDHPRAAPAASRTPPTRPATILRKMAEAAWICGDPGIQYDTTINDWHTSREHGPDLRVQPVLRIHVPERHGVQPRLAEPHEVRAATTASSTSRRTASPAG